MTRLLRLLEPFRRIRRLATPAAEIAREPLTRGRPLADTWRFVRQRRARRTGDYAVIRYVGDAVLAWPGRAGSVEAQAKSGLGEFYDQGFCLHPLRSRDLFCDVGANAGVYTMLASKVVGARGVSFEPFPCTFALLMQNIWANDIAGLVEAHQRGLGREAGALHSRPTD